MIKYYRKIWRNGVWLVALLLVLAGCLPFGLERGSGLIVYVGMDHNIYTIDQYGEKKQAVTSDALIIADGDGGIVFTNSLPGLQIVIDLLLSRLAEEVMEPKWRPSSLLNRMAAIWLRPIEVRTNFRFTCIGRLTASD